MLLCPGLGDLKTKPEQRMRLSKWSAPQPCSSGFLKTGSSSAYGRISRVLQVMRSTPRRPRWRSRLQLLRAVGTGKPLLLAAWVQHRHSKLRSSLSWPWSCRIERIMLIDQWTGDLVAPLSVTVGERAENMCLRKKKGREETGCR